MSDQLEQQLRHALAAEALDAPEPGDLAGVARRKASLHRTRSAAVSAAALGVGAATVGIALLGPSGTATVSVPPAASNSSVIKPVPAISGKQEGSTPTPLTGKARQEAVAQEAVQGLAELVRAAIARDGLDGFSSMSVDIPGQQVHLWWVGPVPTQLTRLAERSTSPQLDISSASFTEGQMDDAMTRVGTLFRTDAAHPDWKLSTVSRTTDGSGITASIVPPGTSAPALSAARLRQIKQQISQLAAPVTLTDLTFEERPTVVNGMTKSRPVLGDNGPITPPTGR